MGHYQRFFSHRPVSMDELAQALAEADKRYRLGAPPRTGQKVAARSRPKARARPDASVRALVAELAAQGLEIVALHRTPPPPPAKRGTPKSEHAELTFGRRRVAALEINHAGDPSFYAERNELVDLVADEPKVKARPVLTTLRKARCVVAAQVLGRDPGKSLELLEPLWTWLFEERSGLLQDDEVGFYRGEKVILALG
jgi:hypothetical protein